MQSSNILIRISGPTWINVWENFAYWEESEKREVLADELYDLMLITTPGESCNFSPLVSLERAFIALKMNQNCYLNMNISFS